MSQFFSSVIKGQGADRPGWHHQRG